MSGKDWIVQISNDHTSLGTPTSIEDQGDLTVTPGKTLNRTAYKDSSRTAQGNEGWSATYNGALRTPLGTGQALLWAAYTGDLTTYIWVTSSTTGGVEWEGPVKVLIDTFEFPVDGEENVSVTFSENGTMTEGLTA